MNKVGAIDKMVRSKLTETRASTDATQERILAAARFAKGDRVRHVTSGKVGTFDAVHNGFAVPEVWVFFDSEFERPAIPNTVNPMELELCSSTQSLTPSAGLVESPEVLKLLEDSQQLNLLKSNPNDRECLLTTGQASPSTMIFEPLPPMTELGMSFVPVPPAPIFLAPTRMAEDLTRNDQDSGGKSSESSENADPDLLSGKTSLLPDMQNQGSPTVLSPELSGALPASGMYANGKLSAQLVLEHPTDEPDSLLLPTPMAHSRASTEYRPPGQDKLEQKLRELGAIPPGEVSTPEFREWMMGFPPGWTNITEEDGGTQMSLAQKSVLYGEPLINELPESPLSETAASASKRRSHGGESPISTLSCIPTDPTHEFAPGDRVILIDEPKDSLYEISKVSGGHATCKCIAYTPGPGRTGKTLRVPLRQIRLQSRAIADIPSQPALPLDPDLVYDDASICANYTPITKDGYLALNLISTDGGTQSRAKLNDATTLEYAEAMDAGAQFPPVLVFYDGEESWLADGFHRVAAAKRLEWTDIAVETRSGTRRDAVLFSVGANAAHGLRRTNADKRRAVETLLRDEEWGAWPDKKIAATAAVSREYIVRLRKKLIEEGELSCDRSQDSQRVAERNGTTYAVDTANIGKKSKETGVVERLKQRDATPPPIHYAIGAVVMIRSEGNPDLRKYDGRWAIARAVNEYTVSVAVDDKEMGVEPKFLEPVEEKYWEEVKQIYSRIVRLQQCDLDPMEDAGLETLKRRIYFTDKQKLLLKRMEEDYGVVTSDTLK